MASFDLNGIGMTSQRTRDRLVRQLKNQGIESLDVLKQIGRIPRHICIDEALAHSAYENTALPIGHGQTISQPFIVALMTQLLFNTRRARVLEVGTGCGYQTAMLAPLCHRVYTLERIEALIPKARARLQALGLTNVQYKNGDGYAGWPVQSPFDGILVTAAPPEVPQPLLDQLEVGGRMVLPVGGDGIQQLRVIDRTEDGYQDSVAETVRFVPLREGVARQ